MTPDDYTALLPFATEAQARNVRALVEHGSQRKAAKALGITNATLGESLAALRRRAAKRGYPHVVDHVPDGMHVERLHTSVDAKGNVQRRTVQARSGMPEAPEPPPEGAAEKFRTVVTRPGENGPEEVMRWTRYESGHTPEDFLTALDVAIEASKIPARAEIPPPRGERDPALLNVVPIGDPHFGMLAWAAECGANWDLRIASKVHREALLRLYHAMPRAGTLLLAAMGDNSHINDSTNETPRGKNRLDTDGRFDRVLATLELACIDAIDTGLEHHDRVRFLVVRGNHDPEASTALGRILTAYYRHNPRVEIVAGPRPVHTFVWGPNLLVMIHGHEPKPEAIPGELQANHRAEIGQTEYAFLYSGHVHSRNIREKDAVRMESVATLAARDSHAARNGYNSLRSIFGDTYHRDYLSATDRKMVSARDVTKDAT